MLTVTKTLSVITFRNALPMLTLNTHMYCLLLHRLPQSMLTVTQAHSSHFPVISDCYTGKVIVYCNTGLANAYCHTGSVNSTVTQPQSLLIVTQAELMLIFFSSFVMFTVIQTQCHIYGFKGSVNSNGYTRLVISDCCTKEVNAYYYTDLVNADCSTGQVIFDSFKGPVYAFLLSQSLLFHINDQCFIHVHGLLFLNVCKSVNVQCYIVY